MNFKEELFGERLVLKQTRPTQEMAELIFQAVDANREHLRPFSPWEKNDNSVESCMNYLKTKEAKTEAGERVEYGIFIKDPDTYIGNIQIFNISRENRCGEFGYWLVKDATGHGYMREAVHILEEECFTSLGLHRIQITCDVLNEASTKVIKACGYTYEGTLREDMVDEYRDTMRNTLMFSKLRSEFDAE
ncbi:MAG: GNAT family N-acetyltransferase [Candidatus Marinimicrobia bacterium]|nr:GNAT family N-acetyltransferase [Candidatus Neomarinimicrobiota bacterium]